jgi:dipeptidase
MLRFLLPICVALAPTVSACSNVIVSPAASVSGAALLGDNDDSGSRHGLVTHFDAANHSHGAMREVWHFETGVYLGSIPQPPHTNGVMAHANDRGLVIGETTHGGLRELSQHSEDGNTDYILDYGSLIHITLQRAATAREAIHTIANLTEQYGYATSMEGFSIADGSEAWYMELIGKGKHGQGIVWVALRVPDGYITAHANQARITTFLPCDDPDQCMAAPDAVSFAISIGAYNGSETDARFSFSDTYDPVTPTGARFCEARVWYVFSQVADPADFNASYYLPYAQGFDLTRRMPLFVRPKRKLSRADVHAMLSSHYQGSWLDPAKDVGAGAEHSPYRFNGLSWKNKGKSYVNERVVGTQYTAWHYVAEVRGDPTADALKARVWWGADDHAWAPKIPLYGGATAVHRTYDDGNCSARLACRHALGLPGDMMNFSWESAFWVNSAVANFLYGIKDRAAPVVTAARQDFDEWAVSQSKDAEAKAARLFKGGERSAGQAVLTQLAKTTGAEATARWRQLFQDLMVGTRTLSPLFCFS